MSRNWIVYVVQLFGQFDSTRYIVQRNCIVSNVSSMQRGISKCVVVLYTSREGCVLAAEAVQQGCLSRDSQAPEMLIILIATVCVVVQVVLLIVGAVAVLALVGVSIEFVV
jgi:hypothetical protein